MHQVALPVLEVARLRGRDLRQRHEQFVDVRVELIARQVGVGGKDAQRFGRNWIRARIGSFADQIDFTVEDFTCIASKIALDKTIGCLADVLPVGMITHTYDRVDAVTRAIEAVQAFESVDDAFVCIHREDAVLVTVDEQQRSRRDESGDSSPGPLERVVEKHTVAVSVDQLGWARRMPDRPCR